MTQFDQLLRRALMDANRAQYQRVLQSADVLEPDFSPGYLRERMHLLADPWGWEKRQRRAAPRRGLLRGIAVAIAVLLLVTAAAAVTAPLWIRFFGGLDQRQQEILDGMAIGGGEGEETAAGSRLPPPVEHNGVTITPLSILAAKNQLYMVLEIRAPEGTVFRPEDDYILLASTGRSEKTPAGTQSSIGRFTVMEAGTKEPNVLLVVVEERASHDIGGCPFVVRGLERHTPDGEQETVFGGWDPETGPTDSWEIRIPEDLNGDRVMELPVEGLSMTDGQKTMTLLSMSVSPLGVWWTYQLDGEDPWPQVRIALRMKDGAEIEADPSQLTMGSMTSDRAATVNFKKPVDLSQAEALLWGDVKIPLEQPEQDPE